MSLPASSVGPSRSHSATTNVPIYSMHCQPISHPNLRGGREISQGWTLCYLTNSTTNTLVSFDEHSSTSFRSGLSWLMVDPAHRCRINIWGAYGNHNLRDTMSMYEVWRAGVMIAGMCARFNKRGKYQHLGECSISVQMT